MPSPLPTTSLVAVASARILAAYLTNHKLSPAEAASLGGKIAHTLGRLTGAASLTSTRIGTHSAPPACSAVKHAT